MRKSRTERGISKINRKLDYMNKSIVALLAQCWESKIYDDTNPLVKNAPWFDASGKMIEKGKEPIRKPTAKEKKALAEMADEFEKLFWLPTFFSGRNYSELINAGVTAQMEKLKANEHKCGWDKLPRSFFKAKLQEEFDETMQAFREIEEFHVTTETSIKGMKKLFQNLRHEAADVANIAHMTIQHCDKIIAILDKTEG